MDGWIALLALSQQQQQQNKAHDAKISFVSAGSSSNGEVNVPSILLEDKLFLSSEMYHRLRDGFLHTLLTAWMGILPNWWILTTQSRMELSYYFGI